MSVEIRIFFHEMSLPKMKGVHPAKPLLFRVLQVLVIGLPANGEARL